MGYFWEDYGFGITLALVVAAVILLGWLGWKAAEAEDQQVNARCESYLALSRSASDSLNAMVACDQMKQQVATRRQEAANAAIIAGSLAGSAASRR